MPKPPAAFSPLTMTQSSDHSRRSAELGVMGANQAVGIIHRRDLEAAADAVAARRELADAYAGEHLLASAAARDGFIDEVVAPSETRSRLAWGLDVLAGRSGRRGETGNIPL